MIFGNIDQVILAVHVLTAVFTTYVGAKSRPLGQYMQNTGHASVIKDIP